jgi:hypothetical protein
MREEPYQPVVHWVGVLREMLRRSSMRAACLKLEAEDDDRLRQVDLAPARSIPLCLHCRRALLAAFELQQLPTEAGGSKERQEESHHVVRSVPPKPT